jgi:hypothetical protein
MTNTPMEMLVFKDADGHYYVMPRQAWEQARVPDERRHEVERLLAAGGKTAAKVGDLPPRDMGAVRGGAVSAQAVGSFRTTSPVGPNPGAYVWSTPPSAP